MRTPEEMRLRTDQKREDLAREEVLEVEAYEEAWRINIEKLLEHHFSSSFETGTSAEAPSPCSNLNWSRRQEAAQRVANWVKSHKYAAHVQTSNGSGGLSIVISWEPEEVRFPHQIAVQPTGV